MFGYCKYDKEELKFKDIRRYSSFYCTLCHALGKQFGLPYRLMLSHDTTFLLICFDIFSSRRTQKRFRCPFNPLKVTSISIDESALEYVSFLNFYLILRKFRDNIYDQSSRAKRLLSKFLFCLASKNKQYQNISQKYATLVKVLDKLFAQLDSLENQFASFDSLTNVFGTITGQFASGYFRYVLHAPEDPALTVLFFNIGKWIYLADALDDYYTDIKQHNFNLLQTIRTTDHQPVEEEYIRKCAIILRLLQEKELRAFQQIPHSDSHELISNILFDGSTNTFKRIVRLKFNRDDDNNLKRRLQKWNSICFPR